jgi:hypothetical protein
MVTLINIIAPRLVASLEPLFQAFYILSPLLRVLAMGLDISAAAIQGSWFPKDMCLARL